MRTLKHANKPLNTFAYLLNVLGMDILVLCRVYPRITFGDFSNVRGRDILDCISFPRTLVKQQKVSFSQKDPPFHSFSQKKNPMSLSLFFFFCNPMKKLHQNWLTISRVIKGGTQKKKFIKA